MAKKCVSQPSTGRVMAGSCWLQGCAVFGFQRTWAWHSGIQISSVLESKIHVPESLEQFRRLLCKFHVLGTDEEIVRKWFYIQPNTLFQQGFYRYVKQWTSILIEICFTFLNIKCTTSKSVHRIICVSYHRLFSKQMTKKHARVTNVAFNTSLKNSRV